MKIMLAQAENPMFWVIPITVVAGLLVLFIFSIPAIQAKRRGYSFFIWLIAGVLALNPIYLLVVLSTIPHRKRQKMREQFAAELDAKLTSAGLPIAPVVRPVPDRSIGDLATMDPATTASRPILERSLGDEMTRVPEGRSLGDEATRG